MTPYFTHTMYLCASHVSHRGYVVAQSCSAVPTALQDVRSLVRFTMMSLEFFIKLILPAALWLWVRISLQHKWVSGQMRPVCRAKNLTTFMCRLLGNMRASNFWIPQGISRPVQELLYLTCFSEKKRNFFSLN